MILYPAMSDTTVMTHRGICLLTGEMVVLGARAAGKRDAIQQAGELLVEAGCVSPSYVAGMLAREELMSTYLGQGIALPHGRRKYLQAVIRTGISVIQLPTGIEWDPGEQVHLVIGLASNSDEHSGVLSNLLELLQEPEAIAQLINTTDPIVIVERLTR